MGQLRLLGEPPASDDHAALANLAFPQAGHTGFVGLAGPQTITGEKLIDSAVGLRFGHAAGPLLQGPASGSLLTITGRAQVTDRLSVVAAPDANRLINAVGSIAPSVGIGAVGLMADVAAVHTAATRNVTGCYGAARAQHTGTAICGGAYGLFFYAYHDSALTTNSLTGIYTYLRSGAAGTGPLTAAYGIDIGALWQASQPATVTGIRLPNLGGAGVGQATGLQISDQTAAIVHLLEIGPATPYLRLLGGAAPGANLTNLYLNEGGTLRRIQWIDPGNGGANLVAGQRVMVLV